MSPSAVPGGLRIRSCLAESRRRAVLSVHPNSDLWLRPPPDAIQIQWSYGIFDGAYQGSEGSTDGVEFAIYAEALDGRVRRIYRRVLDPVRNPGDRGDQHEIVPYEPQPGESLRFSTRPFETAAKDWAYTVAIEVK